jgi:hypothetical protein
MDTLAHGSAELVRIAAQKAAAKEECKTSLQRIEKNYRDMDMEGSRDQDDETKVMTSRVHSLKKQA